MSAIHFRLGGPPRRHPAVVIIGAAVSLGLITWGLIEIFGAGVDPWPWIGGALAYLAVSYTVIPEEDETNLGLFGGLIDNPFSFSDDANRFLLVWRILFLPGRLISESIVGALLLPFRGNGDDDEGW